MKHVKWFFCLALMTTFVCSSCYFDDEDNFNDCERGDGPIQTRILNLSDFHSIDLKIGAEIRLTQGNQQLITVEGQPNILDLLELDVQNGRWNIEYDRCVNTNDDIKIFITLPQIRNLDVSGSGLIFGENTFEVDEIDLRISGSGDIDLALDANEVDSRISGSGEVRLEGITDDFDFELSGSGDYEAFNLESRAGEVGISGSGNAEVFVSDRLDVEISGSGDVLYKGRPILNVDISGSGRVVDAN